MTGTITKKDEQARRLEAATKRAVKAANKAADALRVANFRLLAVGQQDWAEECPACDSRQPFALCKCPEAREALGEMMVSEGFRLNDRGLVLLGKALIDSTRG